MAGYTQHDIQQFRVREGGVQLSNNAHYTLVTQVFKRKIDQIEVDAFQIHPGGGGDVAPFGASVAETADGRICRKAIELLYRLHFTYFGK